LLLLAATAAAQQGQLGGPLAGYVYDSSALALRPVRGVPGGATLGDPLALAFAPQSGFVAPRQDLAVLVSSDGVTHWFQLSGNAATEVVAKGSIATPQRVVFSPTGTAAALIAGGKVQVVTGLPGNPALAGGVTLEEPKAAARPSAVSLAVSDDGAWLLLARGTNLQLLPASGASSATLAPIGGSAVVAFAPASHDAAMSSGGVLTWIHDAAGSASSQVVAQNSALARAVGVAFSADGKSLYAANGGGLVLSVDLAAGTSVEQTSNAPATAMESMGDFFRLNQAGDGPLWLVDPNAGSPRVFFVPPPATSN
jgi:hypothetical protein